MTNIQKTVALVFGIVFLLIGALGFVPALTPNEALLGIFMLNPLHSVVHLLFGVLGIAAAFTATGRLYNRGVGVVYLILGILGFIPPLMFSKDKLLGLVMINAADNLLHLIIGVVLCYVGFALQSPRTSFQQA